MCVKGLCVPSYLFFEEYITTGAQDAQNSSSVAHPVCNSVRAPPPQGLTRFLGGAVQEFDLGGVDKSEVLSQLGKDIGAAADKKRKEEREAGAAKDEDGTDMARQREAASATAAEASGAKAAHVEAGDRAAEDVREKVAAGDLAGVRTC